MTPDTSALDHIARRFDAAAARFERLLAALGDDMAARATPCDGWTVADVIAHVADTQADFLQRHGHEVGADAESPAQARLHATVAAISEVLADPSLASAAFEGYFGPTTFAETIDRFYTGDLIVHRWDVAVACGRAAEATLTDDEIAHVRGALETLPDEVMRMPGLFGPAIAFDDDADVDATTRLMGWLGRRR